MFLLFSKEQLEIQDADARILLCIEPIEHLVQLFPTTEQRERVEYGGELLGKAKTLRFTNALGTDVTYQLGTYPVITEYGYTDTPGRWDHWPSGGMVLTCGEDDGIDGSVFDVLQRFDAVCDGNHRIPLERQHLLVQSAERGIIVDDQDSRRQTTGWGHGRSVDKSAGR